MTKAIISSSALLKTLRCLPDKDQHNFSFNKIDKTLVLDYEYLLYCECNGSDIYNISKESIDRMIKVLMILQEQPLTIAVDSDNWLYIKEAIL